MMLTQLGEDVHSKEIMCLKGRIDEMQQRIERLKRRKKKLKRMLPSGSGQQGMYSRLRLQKKRKCATCNIEERINSKKKFAEFASEEDSHTGSDIEIQAIEKHRATERKAGNKNFNF